MTKLTNFLDDKNIQTGETLDGEFIMMIDDYRVGDMLDKLRETIKILDSKELPLSEFLQEFKSSYMDCDINYQENYVYCGSCGKYAYHNDYGVNDEYYINGDCEAICKDCMVPSDYIDFLINNKSTCNVMLTDEQIQENKFTIIDYDFKNDMYGGAQTDKELLEKIMSDNNIDFFYYLNKSHMFGTYYTICVIDSDVEKTSELLRAEPKLYQFISS